MANLTQQARALLGDMARDHGLRALEPDADGLIPVTLDDGFVFTLAFDGVNNAVFVMTVLGQGARADVPAWPAFGWNHAHAARRTRIAREPGSGALVLLCDIALTGLEYRHFATALQAFTEDAADAARAMGLSPAATPAARVELPAFSPDEMVIFRP